MAVAQGSEGAVLNMPVIVLVRPQMGENIGAAARAMLNFGLTRLRLVAPRDGWPNPAATAMAAGADVVLARAAVFETLPEALADLSVVWATTARPRELALPVLLPEAAFAALGPQVRAPGAAWGVLFGAERTGLSTAEVAMASAVLSYPVNPAFGSLNLASAVGVFGYAWAMEQVRAGATEGLPEGVEPVVPARREEFEGLWTHLIEELNAAEFFLPPDKAEGMQRNLRAALTRAGFTRAEVLTLRGIIKALTLGPKRQRAMRDAALKRLAPGEPS
jgi:tRNA/rRNA methyltransferase